MYDVESFRTSAKVGNTHLECDFDALEDGELFDQCRLYAEEGIAKNVYQCKVKNYGFRATCANNCRGVDPNSIIGGGVAAVALTGIAGQSLLAPALGAAGLAGDEVISQMLV